MGTLSVPGEDKQKMTVSEVTAFLESAYSILNIEYFGDTLPECSITIQSSPKAYGHFTSNEIWQADSGSRHEINLGAETLNRPIEFTIATLIHEMVHCYCHINDIQDTSRNGTYHNKRFKAEAEKRGLIIGYDKRIGHSPTTPSQRLIEFCRAQNWQDITLHRAGEFGADGKPKAPSSTRKYICPCCGSSVRATKDVHILCIDCNEPMELAEKAGA